MRQNRGTAILTGTVVALGRNSIEIRDEKENYVVKRLTYFKGKEEIKIGDRVRLWIDERYGVVERIKVMTPVEYKEKGQNGGYILKKS